jgi:site-specific recombinase XerD
MQNFSRKLVSDYLLWLEQNEGCSVSTANHRLSTIQAFMKFVAVEHPDFLGVCTAVLTIKPKTASEKAIDYLAIDELTAIFAQPTLATMAGKRDIAILTLLYDSGARVQELIDICVGDIRIPKPATVILHGKGNKARIVPIVEETARILERYLSTQPIKSPQQPLFTNRGGGKLSRSGIEFIITKHATSAIAVFPSLAHKKNYSAHFSAQQSNAPRSGRGEHYLHSRYSWTRFDSNNRTICKSRLESQT